MLRVGLQADSLQASYTTSHLHSVVVAWKGEGHVALALCHDGVSVSGGSQRRACTSSWWWCM
eukprot:364988-Chlamydomonas_euryale.AAC.27